MQKLKNQFRLFADFSDVTAEHDLGTNSRSNPFLKACSPNYLPNPNVA